MALGKAFGGIKSGTARVPFEVDIQPNPYIIIGQLEGLAASVRSFKVPLERSIKQVVIPSITKNFAVEGRPPWEPLAPETAFIRESEGFAGEHPILIRTGSLYKAATAFARWDISRDQAFVSNWPGYAWYGPIHQAGSGASDVFGTVGLPARVFMAIQDEDSIKIEAIFAEWVIERAVAAGFRPGF